MKQRSGPLSAMKEAAGWYTNRLCRFAVEEFLARGIEKGSLTFVHADGTETVFGETAEAAREGGRPVGRVRIENEAGFYGRVATSADIGFAEAFMAGEWSAEAEELTRVFRVLILNRDSSGLSASGLVLSWLGRWVNGLLHVVRRNTVGGSQRNVEAHYDLSNELFGTFLGESWTYSCGYFGAGDEAGVGAGAEAVGLDRAQRNKMDMIIDKARLHAGCHVLEIGCGWGELAIRAAQRSGCRVTGITLSREQLQLGRKRVAAAGVGDRVSLELMDYRAVGAGGARYDRVVSVEMLEAVGHEFLPEFFAAVGRALKADGLAVLQVITTPECRYDAYRGSTDFIQKHVFPGGVCPSFEAIVRAMAAGSALSVESVQNIGVHYATTLREWRARFLQAVRDGRVRRAGFDDTFVRKWVYYLCYCEAGFATRTLGDLQIVASATNNTATLGGAPCAAAAPAAAAGE